ncbi:cytochrome c oxidase assembly protein [Stagnihabitans tardus]|uniref:Cytochrome c oxidase assembly protein CtaG n=1 Tax=Stagnihabitans tardus TaxID=2699202 RepID=A0AAE4YHB0_9RHOB|nr:cytochrome c oxidase assembly protein [Stagnihabitans tardus]NBZ89775.1 cytochrome c oxidase assembly protein [Stagnihabitans tardus]
MRDARNKTAAWLALVALVMVSLSFAAVPFYRWFCQVTGFGGTTAVAEIAPAEVLDQTIRVRFDASIERGMPWSFKPVQRMMEIKIGESGLAFYEAHNPTDRPIAGQASYNVSPDQAGGYFTKIECFCFTEQVLQPGETVQMPVTFFVDPEITRDREAKYIREITLSYTFHQIPLPEAEASLAPAPAQPVN